MKKKQIPGVLNVVDPPSVAAFDSSSEPTDGAGSLKILFKK